MSQEQSSVPMAYTARFWFSGLEEAVDFQIVEADFQRFQSYLSDSELKEFFEFDTPGHTVVLANMQQVDAVKLIELPGEEELEELDEEPSEAAVQLVGRFDPFSASTSQEHIGPDHPVRQLLEPDNGKFIQWLDARGQIVVMNPKRLSYLEHPRYWIEEQEQWTEQDESEKSESDPE